MLKGQRVELSPATDMWMRGDRFGTVTKDSIPCDIRYAVLKPRFLISVKMDRSGKTIKIHPRNVESIT